MDTLASAYLAFEACSQHPYAFASFMYGSCPEVLSIAGCAKVDTDDFSLDEFRLAREERQVDADLRQELLVLSMLSPMVFGRRLRLMDGAVPVFSPSNRLSNVLHRSTRRPLARDGDPESGDGGALARILGEEGGLESLARKNKQELQAIYAECFEGSRGMSR